MKTLLQFINENLEIINEAYESKAIQQMMNKLHNLDSYDTGINIYSNILKQPYFLSERQAAKYAHLSKWKDEWFLEKNGKRLFDKKEFLSLVGLNENTKLKDINFFDIAAKKSSCFFILGKRDKNNTSYLGDIECAIIMDPKAGNETANLLKEISKINNDRRENKNVDNSNKFKDFVNNEVKEYYKKASDEQKEILTNTTNELLKYTKAGNNSKEWSIKHKNSDEYNKLRADIMLLLIRGNVDKINNLISFSDYDNNKKNKIKTYLEDKIKKLKVD